MTSPSWKGASLGVVLLAIGCGGGGDPLSEAKHIAGWANSSSALGVYVWGYDPIAIAGGAETPSDPACPTVADDGTTVTIDGGGCTDGDGTQWLGSATVVRDATGRLDVTLMAFDKAEDPSLAAPISGTFVVTELAADRHAFDVDISVDGGIDNRTTYQGTVQGGYTGPTVWNGSGTIHREALVINSGTVEATTVDQLRDGDLCPGEGISGTTTMVSEEHTVVISYDGATDCDDDDAAHWSRDGEDQGLVKGVTCSAGGRGDPAGAAAMGLLVLVAAALGSRRR